jgi:hypothetical protein
VLVTDICSINQTRSASRRALAVTHCSSHQPFSNSSIDTMRCAADAKRTKNKESHSLGCCFVYIYTLCPFCCVPFVVIDAKIGLHSNRNRVANTGLSTLNPKRMSRNKIRESVHRYILQVLTAGSGVVHIVPLQYYVYLTQDFRISVLSLTFRESR